MIIKQNTFLAEVAVVPIFGLQKEKESKFYEIFSNVLYVYGLERTRKTPIINNYSK